jgi:hypothetical protein
VSLSERWLSRLKAISHSTFPPTGHVTPGPTLYSQWLSSSMFIFVSGCLTYAATTCLCTCFKPICYLGIILESKHTCHMRSRSTSIPPHVQPSYLICCCPRTDIYMLSPSTYQTLPLVVIELALAAIIMGRQHICGPCLGLGQRSAPGLVYSILCILNSIGSLSMNNTHVSGSSRQDIACLPR